MPARGTDSGAREIGLLDWGRDVCGRLESAERREWLCANGLGGFASGTVAGLLTRRYHGLLTAALAPPVGRTLLVAKLDETARYAGARWELATNRWADRTIAPHGYRLIERFRLEGTTPVWTYAIADALLEKRIWMEPSANTTYVRYQLLRGAGPVELELLALVNHRDYHATTRGEGWAMRVEPVDAGLRVIAFEGARPILIAAPGTERQVAHVWHERFDLALERERGLDAVDDHLHAGTFRAKLRVGDSLTITCSAETDPALDGEGARRRRVTHEESVLAASRNVRGIAPDVPRWLEHLILAADQFVVARPLPGDSGGQSIIAGYPWFADWGRDTMISLPGLLLSTGRHEIARRILTTFARFVDRGMLLNRFPDAGASPEYNTVDAALWYVEAVGRYYESTKDQPLLAELFPVLDAIMSAHRAGTRYGIGEDRTDGLLRAGEPGVQLTWMDAKVGDWVVTPRTGKPVEVNALWYNALRRMAQFATSLGHPAAPWTALADRVRGSFSRFWNDAAGYCFDVIDGPDGHEDALRPNQIFAVSLPSSPLTAPQQRGVVDECARALLTSFGLRSLAPNDPHYRGSYTGAPAARDGAYHQGPVWAWLLGPFALAHLRVYGDRGAARALFLPMAHHVGDYGIGSIAEIFEGDPPCEPKGCPAQAWSVAEVIRAWMEIASSSEPRA